MQLITDTTLARQLKRLKLNEEEAPSPEQWQRFLGYLDDYYKHMSDDRDMLAHSLEVSTEEMARVREEVVIERDQLRKTLSTFQLALDDFAEACRATKFSGGENTTAITGTRKRFNLAVVKLMSLIDDNASENRELLNALRLSFVNVFEEVISMVSPGRAVSDEMIRLHHALIPHSATLSAPNLQLQARCDQLNEIGGDLWFARPLPSGQFLFCIGDATGHGTAAGLLSAVVASSLETWVSSQNPGVSGNLEELHAYLNQIVSRIGNGQMFMTWCSVLIEPDRRSALLLNAGHTFPLLLRVGKANAIIAQGNPLGNANEERVRQGRIQLLPRDRLLFFTDGLTEARHESAGEFGERRLRHNFEQLTSHTIEETLEVLFAQVHQFSAYKMHDDATLAMIQID